jgi:hypothetical protein
LVLLARVGDPKSESVTYDVISSTSECSDITTRLFNRCCKEHAEASNEPDEEGDTDHHHVD